VRSCYIAGAEWVHIDICDGTVCCLNWLQVISFV
jgi:pentose-5-phosphate-3-epimerase